MKNVFICGNWKMNKTISETNNFIHNLKQVKVPQHVEIGIAPVFTSLNEAKNLLKESKLIKLCAQNVFYEENGAFTGEISPIMLKEIGVDYIILGHSERRIYFNETNDLINKKINACLEHDFKIIFCIGESLEERENDKTFDVLREQILVALNNIDSNSFKNITIAYEPVWAIGTGKTATDEEANSAHNFIKKLIKENFGVDSIRVLYGGSVKPENINGLMSQESIDGALVGGASLNIDSFVKLINFKFI